MATMGLYFSMDKASTNALRARLNEIAARYGYTADRGKTTGKGNLSELLLAIDAGEVATVFMSDGVKALVPWLEAQQNALLLSDTFDDHQVHEAIGALKEQIAEAADREAEADAEDVVSYFEPKSKREIAIQMIERGLRLLKEAEQEG